MTSGVDACAPRPRPNALNPPDWGAHLTPRDVTAIAEVTDPRDAQGEVRTITKIVCNFFIDRRHDTRRDPTTPDDTP